jgi:hypothetical protein
MKKSGILSVGLEKKSNLNFWPTLKNSISLQERKRLKNCPVSTKFGPKSKNSKSLYAIVPLNASYGKIV